MSMCKSYMLLQRAIAMCKSYVLLQRAIAMRKSYVLLQHAIPTRYYSAHYSTRRRNMAGMNASTAKMSAPKARKVVG